MARLLRKPRRGWAVTGTWSAANYYAANSTDYSYIYRSQTSDDLALWMSYYVEDEATNESVYLRVWPPREDMDNNIVLKIRPHAFSLYEEVGGETTTLGGNAAFTTAKETWYNLYIECDGDHIEVWRGTEGGLMSQARVQISTQKGTEIVKPARSTPPSRQMKARPSCTIGG